ncbi:C40 family peptidase [Sphingobacterium bambusae]|uniref:NlpC/P60 family protein n=1 Tax=Sphingobacterium bambusae TaxID=662858 RepID=A0ABW6BBG4_9SPHI|nr:C40 family peptidase [Sphingobacterium bambusae]WPL49221.1 C40 family peptidase [Sphingobacterium bambusae]
MKRTTFAGICSTVFLLLLSITAINAQQKHSEQTIIEEKLAAFRINQALDKRTSIVELIPSDSSKAKYDIQITDPALRLPLEKEMVNIIGKVNIIVLPDTGIGEKKKGLINLSVANLRTQPSHAAEMATQLLLGAAVDILQKKAGDYRVRTAEGYIAWVPTSSVTPITEKELRIWNAGKRMIYTNEFGKSLSAPDQQSLRVSDLVYGNIMTLLAEEKNYYKVAYPDGRQAYIPKQEATLFTEWQRSRIPSAETVLQSAKTMLGLPYLWGGTSVKGVDCSGFTKMSYFMNGLVIPRDASQQALHGESIDILDNQGNFDTEKALKNLKPADLLFFAGGKNKNSNARVTHVALYLGDGQFIHAAGTVRINSMLKEAANYDDFQARTVVAARRYLGTSDPAVQQINNSSYYNNVK